MKALNTKLSTGKSNFLWAILLAKKVYWPTCFWPVRWFPRRNYRNGAKKGHFLPFYWPTGHHWSKRFLAFWPVKFVDLSGETQHTGQLVSNFPTSVENKNFLYNENRKMTGLLASCKFLYPLTWIFPQLLNRRIYSLFYGGNRI